ncbi:hypothetical protein [Paenibacillus hunanensis]|uniref:hypothetical protein n=1 Tax=Paenibacillus hunanensis TaxID=539262 RepID=UPI00166F203C|nr:hypothetical protein [Paenibacillus hunanensis]MCL9660169.1 hypothetical protein [Paenibacillus hunanensis]GGJ22378.1 hypothetical protein GCM10008022_34070 [Paenibacillus hunanensis]
MIGNIKINVWSGVLGFLITFLFSLGNNLWTTSLVRGCLGFILWFALAFLLRFILGVLATPGNNAGKPPASGAVQGIQEDEGQPLNDEPGRGNLLDITTPDQDNELNDLLTPKPSHSDGDNGFAPLNPPKLVSTKEQDPEELAKALRHLTQK